MPRKKGNLTAKLVKIAKQVDALQADDSLIEHPLYSNFNNKCNQLNKIISEILTADDIFQKKKEYMNGLIEQLTGDIHSLKEQHQSDKKRLTASIGSAHLQLEELTKELQRNQDRLQDELNEELKQLSNENKTLKKIARENIKESQLKSEFLNILSHELRTPLNAIIGYSQIIKNGIYGPVNDSIRNDIDAINKNGKHLLRMINQMLDFAKIDSGKVGLNKSKVNIKQFLENVFVQLNSLIGNKVIEFMIEIKLSNKTYNFDKDRVFQVMTNLVDNSIKFTEKGHIKLLAKDYTENNKPYLALSCIDSGCGIEKEEMELIFKAFHQVNHTTSNKQKGTGLGLAICKRIVELHNGKIKVESKFGYGTTFTVLLPQPDK